jgi:hypothetical protein
MLQRGPATSRVSLSQQPATATTSAGDMEIFLLVATSHSCPYGMAITTDDIGRIIPSEPFCQGMYMTMSMDGFR